MKFLVDMPLSPQLAHGLEREGHEAVHVGSIGLHQASDEAIMAHAKAEGRTIVTADLDYPRLLALAQTREPSLILFRHGAWSDAEIISRMGEVLAALPEDQISQSIVTVDRQPIRRRRLPIG